MTQTISRKQFIQKTGVMAAGVLLSPMAFAWRPEAPTIKAIAFDGFPIFDPRPIFKTVNEMFPEKGKHLIEVWQAKQFSYQWLRVAAHQYKDFWEVTKDALDFALLQCGLYPSDKEKQLLMSQYETLNIWPDVVPALESLKRENLTLSFLSNMTPAMLKQGIQHAGIEDYFDFVISTDQKHTFKPSTAAYQMGIDILQLKKEEILFAAFAGWDMAGAKWFGYPTYWVNRLNAPLDKLDAVPDGTGKDLNDLVDFVKAYTTNK